MGDVFRRTSKQYSEIRYNTVHNIMLWAWHCEASLDIRLRRTILHCIYYIILHLLSVQSIASKSLVINPMELHQQQASLINRLIK